LPLQAQGEFALVKEKLESALELSGQPVKRGTMAHKHIIYMMLADAAAQLRDGSAAAHYAPLLEELAVRDGHQPYLAIAQRAWGVAERLDEAYAEADNRLRQALAIFEEIGAHWQSGRTRMELGELALAQGDEAGARDHFARALEGFETLKARPDAARSRAALEALGSAERR
jgi:tetratricopeptide (TPR) repeat protein